MRHDVRFRLLMWCGSVVGVSILSVAAAINPLMALAPVGLLGLLAVLMAPADQVRGLAMGFGLLLLVTLSSNSAPVEARIVGVGATTLVAVIALVRAPKPRQRLAAATVLIVSFIAYLASVTVVTSASSLLTVGATLAAPLFLALLAAKATPSDLLTFLRIVVFLAISQVVIALAEITIFTVPVWGYRNTTLDGTGVVIRYNPFLGDVVPRAQGTLGHPILLALLMLFTLFLCVSTITRSHRLLRSVGVSVAIAGLVLSGTRSALVSATVAAIYLLLSSTGILAKSRNIAVIALAIAVVYVGDFGTRTILSDLLASDSLGHRIDGWALAFGLLERGPVSVVFGSGMNSELSAFSEGYLQQDGFAVIDNQLITTFVVGGVIGLILLVGSLAWSFSVTGRSGRALLISMTVMFFSFDVTTWVISFSLLAISIAIPMDAWPNSEKPNLEPASYSRKRTNRAVNSVAS